MAHHEIASRVTRRMLCLLTLLVGIVMPTILRIFFIADNNKSRLTHTNNWDESLEADVFFAYDDADDSVENAEADAKSMSSSKIITTIKEYRRNNAHNYFTRINAGHDYESNRMLMSEAAIEYNQIVDQKRSIHVIVTTVIAFLLPFLALLYAFIFQKETQGSVLRSLNTRRRRRKERQILQGLQECRIQLPTSITTPEDTTSATIDDDKQRRECPICLLAFTAGDVVIASKHCHCSIPRTKIASSVANNNSLESQFYHRIFFHETCIFTWLSQRKTNPKKLCPCCRQPFLVESKATVVRSS